jgi:hypothetical protein
MPTYREGAGCLDNHDVVHLKKLDLRWATALSLLKSHFPAHGQDMSIRQLPDIRPVDTIGTSSYWHLDF